MIDEPDMLEWRSISPAVDRRVQEVLDSWCGTPYLPAHRIKAMGVDCFQLIAAFLDEIHGAPTGYTKLPKLSPSVARNRPDVAVSAIRILRRSHSGSTVVKDRVVEPGDIVVVRSILSTDGPQYEGHAMIVGSEPVRVLHAIRPRVAWGSYAGREIIRVYRPKEKVRWAP